MAFPSKQTAQAYSGKAQQAAALIKKEKKAPVVGDKTRAAIDAMVFDGKQRKEAAEVAGMSDETLRQMLLKPHVLAYLNEQQEVLRTSFRPRALRKMGDLLDAKTERIQFEAAKYLDGMDRPSHAVGATQVNVQINNDVKVTPGYVVKLVRGQVQSGGTIGHLEADDVIPLETLEDVPEDE